MADMNNFVRTLGRRLYCMCLNPKLSTICVANADSCTQYCAQGGGPGARGGGGGGFVWQGNSTQSFFHTHLSQFPPYPANPKIKIVLELEI